MANTVRNLIAELFQERFVDLKPMNRNIGHDVNNLLNNCIDGKMDETIYHGVGVSVCLLLKQEIGTFFGFQINDIIKWLKKEQFDGPPFLSSNNTDLIWNLYLWLKIAKVK